MFTLAKKRDSAFDRRSTSFSGSMRSTSEPPCMKPVIASMLGRACRAVAHRAPSTARAAGHRR